MRTIAQISDLHFGRHSPEALEHLLTSLHENRPDLVVVSGDFTQRARSSEFDGARRFLDRIPQPKLVVPGNHDVPLYNVFARFMKPFAHFNRYISPVCNSSFFLDEEIAVLGLNTARRFTRKNGRISLKQLDEITNAFRDLPNGIFKTLVTHHPLGVPKGEGYLELVGRSGLALKVATEAGIHLLLSGHHHKASSGSVEQIGGKFILVVHAGTAISSRTRSGDGNTYNLIDINRGSVAIRVMEWAQGRAFIEKRIASYVFEQGRWSPA